MVLVWVEVRPATVPVVESDLSQLFEKEEMADKKPAGIKKKPEQIALPQPEGISG